MLFNFYQLSSRIMNKKLLWIVLATVGIMLILPTHADTTGNVNTWANATGINITGANITGTIATGNFQFIIDPITKRISIIINTGSINTWTTNTWATQTGTITTGQNTMTGVTFTGTEFEQALAWMYANGLTMYDNEEDYRPEDWLLREEAAKIIGQAYLILGYNQTSKNTNCTFSDSADINPTLTTHVTNTCNRGIFKGTTDGKFLPRQQLTRPQTMALLVRIFEGKTSNENRVPRWGDYYIKSQALGLTTLNNQVAFDSSISRREMAIYIRRLRNVVSNETLKLMMLGRLSELNSTESSTTGLLDDFAGLADSLSVNSDPELSEAIRWMNDNGLTSFKTIAEYMPFEILNREQGAKILVMFANVFGLTKTTSSLNCVFEDIGTADASLVTYIEQACQLGIMQGSEGFFSPKNNINKSEFIAAIIRLFEGKKQDETTNPRWKNYFEKAQELGMIGPADAVTFDNPITRYEVALFLYRFKVKFQILQSLNSTSIQNQIISSVPGSIITGSNNMPESRVYVDMNLLNNGNFDIGYIELFGQRYKIVKSGTERYITNNYDNFVRYGNLFTIDTEQETGSASFIVSSLSLIEGTIRLGKDKESTFVISPLSNTNAYYKLNQTK